MGRLIYTAIASADGYIADPDGDYAWAEPDPAVHHAINEAESTVGASLLGRRMYEEMRVWDDVGTDTDAASRDFARQWRRQDKIVYSTTLPEVTAPRTSLERVFDADAIRRMVKGRDDDVSISGPTLAAHAFEAGLVDEMRLYLVPVVVGGGLRALPDGVRARLRLVDERRFDSGIVMLRYAVDPF